MHSNLITLANMSCLHHKTVVFLYIILIKIFS